MDEDPGTGSLGTPEAVPVQAAAPEQETAPSGVETPAAPEPAMVEDADGIRIGGIAAEVRWEDHAETLDRWQQGHLLIDIPVAWFAPPGTDQITGYENSLDHLAPIFDPTTAGPAIITTQTCDLGGLPPGSVHPFLQVAPLIRADRVPQSIRKAARLGDVGYLVPVLSPFPVEPTLNEDGTVRSPDLDQQWYADLRMEVPVSKAVLLDRDPIPGFADEEGYLAFADRLGYRSARPALHSALSKDLPDLLTKFVKDKGGSKQQCFAKVEQVRMVLLGNRLNPTRASFYVIADGLKLDAEERDVWARFQADALKLLKVHGIDVGPMLHCDVHELSAAKYRDSIHVYSEQIGPGRFLL